MRIDGDCVSAGVEAGAEGLWNNFLMSGFSSLGPEEEVAGVVADVEFEADRAGEDDEDGVARDEPVGRAADIDGLPLIWDDVVAGAAGTVPNDLTTLSFMGFGAAGDEDIGADASSIDPKVTGEPRKGRQGGEKKAGRETGLPCFAAAAPMLLLGMLTPSLRGKACPRALDRREWVRWLWD